MSAPWKQKASSRGAGDGEKREVAPDGTHSAVIVGMIDLGTHTEEYANKKTGAREKKDNRKVLFVWELVECPMTGYKDRNHVVGKDFNVSFHESSNLRAMVQKMLNRQFKDDDDFDLSTLMGRQCNVTILHGVSAKNNTYAKWDGVSPLKKGEKIPAAKTKPLTWSLEDGDYPDPEWVPFVFGESPKDMIERCNEYRNDAPLDDDPEENTEERF